MGHAALCWFYYKDIKSTCQRFPTEKKPLVQSSGRAVKLPDTAPRTFVEICSCKSLKKDKGKQETPPAAAMAAGGVSLWVENKKEVKRRMVGKYRFYAAFAGAKTSAFFCRVCMERTTQLRVKLMTK